MREGRNSAVRVVDKAKLADLQTLILHLPNLAGIFYPLDGTDAFEIASPGATLPVPPQSLWHGYGKDEQSYLAGGAWHLKLFYDAYKKHHAPLVAGNRVLDFGCSAGRMVRGFEAEARAGVEVWGCDIDAASIEWCQKNLMPPLRFLTNTTTPHLPFPDRHFDFIYAGSVFSHMNELTSAWLLELSRVTAPGGVCVFTIHSELTWDHLNKFIDDPARNYAASVKYLTSIGLDRANLMACGRQCFLSSPWWVSAWFSVDYFSKLASLGFEVVEVIPELYGYQTGLVLRR